MPNSTTGVNAAINVIQITALIIFSIMAISHRVKHPEGSEVWTMDSTGTPTQYVQAQVPDASKTIPDPKDATKTMPAPYNAANSSGSNAGPTAKSLAERVQAGGELRDRIVGGGRRIAERHHREIEPDELTHPDELTRLGPSS